MDFFRKDNKRAIDAKIEAQKIAWAPFVFQAARVLRDLGILELLENSRDEGMTIEEVAGKLNLSIYGARVLMEAGLGMELIYLNKDDKYALTKTGFFILNDEMTKINMDFVHDVCYQGMYFLEESIRNGKPEGLKVFGNWKTIYEALSVLPDKAQTSWFNFDHYYSDIAFPQLLPLIFKDNPKQVFDVGGNTGKFSMQCARFNENAKITILDLPGQLGLAEKNIKANGLENRVFFHPINLLDHNAAFPKGADAVLMSQFLDCFSEEEIVSILSRAKESLNENGAIYILETYWDRQNFEISAFSLQQTSLYFTVMANGNSQMYHSKNMIQCVQKAGLYIDEDTDNIGITHTLFKCKRK